MMHYDDYGVEDFASDPHFIRWVLQPDPEQEAFWQKWLQHHPEKAALLAEARKMVLFFRFSAEAPTEAEKLSVKQEVLHRIHASDAAAPSPDKVRKMPYLSIAAAIALLLLGTGVLWQFFFLPPYTYYQTSYSESRQVVLADGTVVQMNANSALKVRNDVSEDEPREVWLDGEAFFSVVKQPTAADGRFLVHTDQLTVEVLGTAFNVEARRGNTQVVLNEGKIRLRQKTDNESLLMEPGDMAVMKGQNPLVLSKVNPEKISSWKDNRLFFDNARLEEIFQRLQDIHGLNFQVAEPALLTLRFTGSCPINDYSILLTAISETYQLDISQQKKTISISAKYQP